MGACGFEILGYDAMPAVPALTKLMAGLKDQGQRLLALACIMHIDHGKKSFAPDNSSINSKGEFQIVQSNVCDAADYLANTYPEEAERAGVYKMFPTDETSHNQ